MTLSQDERRIIENIKKKTIPEISVLINILENHPDYNSKVSQIKMAREILWDLQ